MSLVKDEKISYSIVGSDVYTNTGALSAPGYTAIQEITLLSPQSSFGNPSVTPIGSAGGGSANNNGRLIRMATTAEIEETRLALFGNYPIGIVQFTKMENVFKRYTDYGVPIHVFNSNSFILWQFTTGNYISMWWFDSIGPAPATFIGYDPGNPPRQYVELVYSPMGLIPALKG